jgi:hypothetical protein
MSGHHGARIEADRRSVVVGPSGRGEVCSPDRGAIAAGALLVEPSMGRPIRCPDLLAPHVTYAPTRRDSGDGEQVCDE